MVIFTGHLERVPYYAAADPKKNDDSITSQFKILRYLNFMINNNLFNGVLGLSI